MVGLCAANQDEDDSNLDLALSKFSPLIMNWRLRHWLGWLRPVGLTASSIGSDCHVILNMN